MPKRVTVVFARDPDEEDDTGNCEESSDEDADDIEDDLARPPSTAAARSKITLSLKGRGDVCRVCGCKDHRAGFAGATYIDCPNKPCYLCKQPGHTTATCPHRVGSAAEGGREASQDAGRSARTGLVRLLGKRQREGSGVAMTVSHPKKWSPSCAVIKLHKRRCTALEFHPHRNNIVVSGDKSGQVAVWDFKEIFDTTTFAEHHHANTNAIRFLRDGDGMACLSTSADGLLKALDIETGQHETLLNLNPAGWIEGVSNERNWVMLGGLAVSKCGTAIAGDSQGNLHFIDPRANKAINKPQQLHKGKIMMCDVNPAQEDLLLSAGNDHNAVLSDIRCLSDAQEGPKLEICRAPHPRVVTQAAFSPASGQKVLTTCIDNRLRVWDCVYNFDADADREIVHSHDFNRYLTPFRAEWDPKDSSESMVVIGRYISDDFGGFALHPVDLIDVSTGRLCAEMIDPMITTISPVNKVHPRLELIISGSSSSLYAWTRDVDDDKEPQQKQDGSADSAHTGYGFTFYDASENKKSGTKKKKTTA